ncbi:MULTISPECIES: hypothetical protein, partial [unclassified Pantoea]|uniref:hypothetical protein n=1 Tax=unclassified Pantoea TaxID=2630326 RepID=UPI0035BF57C2
LFQKFFSGENSGELSAEHRVTYAVVPCQWRRIIGKLSQSASANLNFFAVRLKFAQKRCFNPF